MSEKKTHIAIVLDRSGSMSSVRQETIELFNEQVETISEHSEKGGETTVSLVTFGGHYENTEMPPPAPDPSPSPSPGPFGTSPGGSGGGSSLINNSTNPSTSREPIEKLFVGESPSRIGKISWEDYVPGGLTPMYDGVGQAIRELEAMDDGGEDTAFLVVIISDGLENHSRQFEGEDIAEKITELQNTGRWTFSFVGDVPDLSEVAQHLNINEANTAAFAANAVGTQNASRGMKGATTSYLDARSSGATSMSSYGDEVEEETSGSSG